MIDPGTWGGFPLFLQEAVHPEDWKKLPQEWDEVKKRWNRDYPHVFEARGMDGKYILLGYGSLLFRGCESAFKPLGIPQFRLDDEVMIKKNGLPGVVYRLDWHNKKQMFIYFLSKSARKSNEWFFCEDLEKISRHNTNQ